MLDQLIIGELDAVLDFDHFFLEDLLARVQRSEINNNNNIHNNNNTQNNNALVHERLAVVHEAVEDEQTDFRVGLLMFLVFAQRAKRQRFARHGVDDQHLTVEDQVVTARKGRRHRRLDLGDLTTGKNYK